MKLLLIVLSLLSVATHVLGFSVAAPTPILLLNGAVAIFGGYYAGNRLREDIITCAFIGAYIVVGYIVVNAFLILFHTFLGLHILKEEAGTAHLLGGLLFSAIMPATILAVFGGVGGYIGRYVARTKT